MPLANRVVRWPFTQHGQSMEEDRMSETVVEGAAKPAKVSNDDRRRDKLRREILRAHDWRVQVWAQMEHKIRAAQAGLLEIGGDQIDLYEPNFKDEEMLEHYSSMPLTK